jgi:ABC-type tungstate transport system substrate-binding protein
VDLLGRALLDALALILRGDPELLRIAALSLAVYLSATVLATLAGIPAGVLLATRHYHGRRLVGALVNTGMGLPPVVVGLTVALFLWRSGPFGALGLIYTPQAMVLAQFIVAAPLAAGLTRSALELLDPELRNALHVDGAGALAEGRELVRAALPQVRVAVAAAFGRALAEVGASLIVGGDIIGHTRILTTAIAAEVRRGEFSLALALGIVLLLLAFIVNLGLSARGRAALARG